MDRQRRRSSAQRVPPSEPVTPVYEPLDDDVEDIDFDDTMRGYSNRMDGVFIYDDGEDGKESEAYSVVTDLSEDLSAAPSNALSSPPKSAFLRRSTLRPRDEDEVRQLEAKKAKKGQIRSLYKEGRQIARQYYCIRFLFLLPTLFVVGLSATIISMAAEEIRLSTLVLSTPMRDYTIETVTKDVREFFDDAQKMNTISFRKWQEGKLNLNFNHDTRNVTVAQGRAQVFRDHLYHLLMDENRNGRNGPRSLYIATNEDLIIQSEFSSATEQVLKQKLKPMLPRMQYEILPESNNTPGRSLTQSAYFPTQRPWWNIVQQRGPGGQNWSALYVFSTSGRLGITGVAKLATSRALEDWEGDAAVDFQTVDIDDFLRSRRPTEKSHLIVYENTGDVVATSFRSGLFPRPASGRYTYLNFPVPVIAAAGNYLNKMSDGFFGMFSKRDSWRFEATLLQERYMIDIQNIVDPDGIDWVLVMLIPEGDIIGGAIRAAEWLTVTATCVGFAVGLASALIGYAILSPLVELKNRIDKQVHDIYRREKNMWSDDKKKR